MTSTTVSTVFFCQLEGDLGEQEGKLAASRESVERVSRELAPIEEKMRKIDDQSAEIYNIQNDISRDSWFILMNLRSLAKIVILTYITGNDLTTHFK